LSEFDRFWTSLIDFKFLTRFHMLYTCWLVKSYDLTRDFDNNIYKNKKYTCTRILGSWLKNIYIFSLNHYSFSKLCFFFLQLFIKWIMLQSFCFSFKCMTTKDNFNEKNMFFSIILFIISPMNVYFYNNIIIYKIDFKKLKFIKLS
jgi:hypothetical protein